MKNKDKYEHLCAEEFWALSDTEKKDYYATLSKERSEARSSEDREAIAEAYAALGRYKSAAHFASELKSEAEAQRQDAELEAAESRKRIFKLGGILLGAVALVVAVALIISAVGSDKKEYGKAVAYYEDGFYSEALEIFNTIPNYKDAKLYITAINGMLKTGTVNGQRARVGDIIKLGSWYTDGDTAQSKKEIAWLVLSVDTEGKRVFAISLEILDSMAYGNTDVWKNSEICSWLNGVFVDEAFSESERKRLDTNLYQETDEEGNILSAFSSKLALMSQAEKEEYLNGTKYISADGANTVEWWLRTAAGEGRIQYVTENGQLEAEGKDSKSVGIGVRPVAWINLD